MKVLRYFLQDESYFDVHGDSFEECVLKMKTNIQNTATTTTMIKKIIILTNHLQRIKQCQDVNLILGNNSLICDNIEMSKDIGYGCAFD